MGFPDQKMLFSIPQVFLAMICQLGGYGCGSYMDQLTGQEIQIMKWYEAMVVMKERWFTRPI